MTSISTPFTAPRAQLRAFNCPHCNAYASQDWKDAYQGIGGGRIPIPDLAVAICEHCHRYSVWLGDKMIFPEEGRVMPPNPDLKLDIQDDYNEAKSIFSKSPRGAAALLRLCIQKLCQQLKLPGKNLDDDIGTLVKNGLPMGVQKSLDIVRVVGNNAVHPGVLDIKDDFETASKLFELVNHIAYSMITQPKEIESLYTEKVPLPQKQAIEKRDSSAKKK